MTAPVSLPEDVLAATTSEVVQRIDRGFREALRIIRAEYEAREYSGREREEGLRSLLAEKTREVGSLEKRIRELDVALSRARGKEEKKGGEPEERGEPGPVSFVST